MKYTVTNAMKIKELTLSNGLQYVYQIAATDESGQEVIGELLQRSETPAPKIGDVFDATVEQTKFGNRFKKERSNNFQGGKSFGKSPEERDEIIRQQALYAAAERGKVIAEIYLRAGDTKLAFEALKPKHLVQVATYFAQYTKGKITVVSEDQESTAPTEPEPTSTKPIGNAPTSPTQPANPFRDGVARGLQAAQTGQVNDRDQDAGRPVDDDELKAVAEEVGFEFSDDQVPAHV